MKIYRMLVAALTFITCSQVHATGFILEAGLHVGGDTVVEVQFTDGDTEKIRAGQLISAAVGIHRLN